MALFIEFEDICPTEEIGESLSGKIGFYTGNDNWSKNHFAEMPCLCFKNYGRYQWMRIDTIGAQKLKDNRSEIAKQYKILYKKYKGAKKRISKLKKNNETNGDEAFMAHLWSSYDSRIQKDVMQEMLKQFHTSSFSKKTCSVCLKFTTVKIKCMHHDCYGMCSDCHKESFGTDLDPIECDSCPSCKKEQKVTCPVCQEDKKNSELIHGDNCSHSICCKCFCLSFNSNPIIECPLCRANFKNTLHHR